MTRYCLAAVCGLLCLTPARAQTEAIQGKIETARYVLKLQTKEGGFLPANPAPGAANQKPSLRATTAAVRAVKYLGVKLPFDRAACAKSVERCYDKASGGFADAPAGKPDVFSTAVGIMAVAELKMPANDYRKGVLDFLAGKVKSFDDIRIAVAGLESIKAVEAQHDKWLAQVLRKQNSKGGTWGTGRGVARETGSAVVAILRMHGPVIPRDEIIKALKKGQRTDGGFGKADADGSDLETTYRVMRAFVMLKVRPDDVEGVRSFIAKCRNDDHGYGVRPDQPSSVGATYYAAIINHWLAKE
jgi:prenyltransferase beta subunit